MLVHAHEDISADRIIVLPFGSSELAGHTAGVGPWKYILLSGRSTDRDSTEEFLFAFGHELGHYALHHREKTVGFVVLLLCVLTYTARSAAQWIIRRRGSSLGIQRVQDWASLPLLLLLLHAVTFLTTPVTNLLNRHFEHEADRYALEAIHSVVADPGQAAVHLLERDTLGHLHGIACVWICNHPQPWQRMQFAATYHPWQVGGKPIYIH